MVVQVDKGALWTKGGKALCVKKMGEWKSYNTKKRKNTSNGGACIEKGQGQL